MGSTATGARLEVCADRACARRLQTVDVAGTEITLPADLPAGPVFWRLTSRRSASEFGVTASPTWVLYVEPGACPLGPFTVRVRDDYDGDGLSDGSRRADRDVVVSYSSGIPSTVFSLPADIYEPTYPVGDHVIHSDPLVFGLGDLSGDGRSDGGWYYSHLSTFGLGHSYGSQWVAALSGPDGIRVREGVRTFNDRVEHSERSVELRVQSAGDIDRDGYGDVLAYRFLPRTGSPFIWRFITHRGEWVLPTLCGTLDHVSTGDINGDSVVDVVIDPCSGTAWFGEPPFALGDADGGGFGPTRDLPPCAALGTTRGRIHPSEIRDVNCDGYGDVVALDYWSSGSGGSSRLFALLGGPDGLSSSRCVLLPTP